MDPIVTAAETEGPVFHPTPHWVLRLQPLHTQAIMDTEHEYPFLEEVYTPSSAPKIDFIFVHGLNPRGRNDHPFDTWRHQNGTFWPRDLLPEDIPHSRVFVYGYNSNVTNSQVMSTASVKDHANMLLNLLDMERDPQINTRPPKIIFIGHSLGGLVIKQALLNAHEDPKYTAIRLATCGLVFFGTPHRGAKGVEVGKIAAKVARFVSNGNASNELLNCLEYDSMFTRQMSNRFSHQLEDYRVVSFVEGKEVLLGGAGPTSVSHLVVEEESAVLGLPGNRETRLKLDADHSQMCKVGSRGPMYKLIKGNIKQIANQVLVAEQGYIPQPQPSPHSGGVGGAPPLPPRMHTNSSSPYPATPQPAAPAARIVGTLFTAIDNDPRSIQAAEQKNQGRWDRARPLEYAIFQDHLRSLGPDHSSTLEVGYHLAAIDVEDAQLNKATEWCRWVSEQSQRILGARHALTMRAESLMSEILCARGRFQEAESVGANVLARQQMSLGEDDLDTLETRRRLSATYSSLGQENSAVNQAERRTAALQRVLGANHIRVISSVLDSIEVLITARMQDESKMLTMRFSGEAQESTAQAAEVAHELLELLGPRHPMSIRALRLQGTLQMLEQNPTEASETLRRALAMAEEALGPEHPEAMGLVGRIGVLYALHNNPAGHLRFVSSSSNDNALELSAPWLKRYLQWAEARQGKDSGEVQTTLTILAQLYMGRQQFSEAYEYHQRLVQSYQAANLPVPDLIQTNLQTCRLRAELWQQYSPRTTGTALGGVLEAFVRKRY